MNLPDRVALSFVIPLYFSADTIEDVVRVIDGLEVEGGHEVVLVNDGSTDATAVVCARLIERCRVPVTYIEHARNFGEHNAVLTGYRHARGDYVVNLDDDGQNPPAEALRLYAAAQENGWDVVFGTYATKRHAAWRNVGSKFANRVMDWMLDKPAGLYLSSFRCVSRLVVQEVARYTGPFPYIDGLILQATQRLGTVEVAHAARQAGQSNYTLRRLVRLWLNTVLNFSVMPLRVATLLGLGFATVGFACIVVVLGLWLTKQGPAFGWGSLMGGLLLFSGVQLAMLGVIGEYIGRIMLTVSGRPQAVVRAVRKKM